ncbi:acyl-CoA ligase (AMP-forming), exosortase A system-associated [Chakrabartia godavariana]|nr:acyl-CoA ligase (AMP-forming), exosortase A system-associated [Chakrabartia godavariana]
MQSPDPTPYPLDHLTLRGDPDRVALIMRDETISYAALENLVGRLAAALRAQGLQRGERVATWLPKTRVACLMPLAAARAGLIHVPVNPALKRAQLAYILEDSGASMLIIAGSRAMLLEEGDVAQSCTLMLEDALLALTEQSDALPASAEDPDSLAAILYTSGSTGRPKGVMLSHANMWLGAISVAHYLEIVPEDRVLGVLPLSFDYGQNQLLSTWASGGTVIPLDYLTARDVVKAVDRHDVTTIAGVPPLWIQLCEADWPETVAAKVRRLTNSGGALTVPLVHAMQGTFPSARLFPMYGLTEAFRSTYLDPALVGSHPTSMGRAIPFAEIMVVRRDGTEAAPDEPGELVHAGPLVAKGYWKDAERTASRFRPAPAFSAYGGTAVWSGDTVRRDADGLLYFVGRDDEMIKSSGNRISPAEIEDAAIASGWVREAVAFGVPDARLGQAICLVVRGEALKEAALQQHLRQELPNFMQPARTVWWDDLPRNPNGKLDRVAIRAHFLEGADA